jgi:hypothetical protein
MRTANQKCDDTYPRSKNAKKRPSTAETTSLTANDVAEPVSDDEVGEGRREPQNYGEVVYTGISDGEMAGMWLLSRHILEKNLMITAAVFDTREAALDVAAQIDELTGTNHIWYIDTVFLNVNAKDLCDLCGWPYSRRIAAECHHKPRHSFKLEPINAGTGDSTRGTGRKITREASGKAATSAAEASTSEQINDSGSEKAMSETVTSLMTKSGDSAEGEVGPNGGRLGYLPNGDKVEWLEEEDEDGKPTEYPMLLLRNENDIAAAHAEFRDKVWWNRHQNWLYAIETGKEPLTEEQKPILETAQKVAREIEERYGKENLGWDDFEWGLLSGKMSALGWVLGEDWETSLSI